MKERKGHLSQWVSETAGRASGTLDTSNAAERAPEAAERASEAVGRASEAAERASNVVEKASEAAERAERIKKVGGRALKAAGKALGERYGNKNEDNEENGKKSIWWYHSSLSPVQKKRPYEHIIRVNVHNRWFI